MNIWSQLAFWEYLFIAIVLNAYAWRTVPTWSGLPIGYRIAASILWPILLTWVGISFLWRVSRKVVSRLRSKKR